MEGLGSRLYSTWWLCHSVKQKYTIHLVAHESVGRDIRKLGDNATHQVLSDVGVLEKQGGGEIQLLYSAQQTGGDV